MITSKLFVIKKAPIQAFWFYNSHQSDTFHYTMYYKDIYLAKKLYRGPIVFRNGSILQFLNQEDTYYQGHCIPLLPIYSQISIRFFNYVLCKLITLVLETNFKFQQFDLENY